MPCVSLLKPLNLQQRTPEPLMFVVSLFRDVYRGVGSKP